MRDGVTGEPPAVLIDGPEDAQVACVLAHGAGAGMDSAFMAFLATGLGGRGIRVICFEFPYMVERRRTGRRRPPDRAGILQDAWRSQLAGLNPGRTVIGGKSLGGRMASMIADEAGVLGLVCLGYPFHPPAAPEKTRIEHLRALRTPTLICQGTRDPFGALAEVSGYPLSPAIRVHWLKDGDHGFKPRRASGRSESDNLEEALNAVGAFIAALGRKDASPAG